MQQLQLYERKRFSRACQVESYRSDEKQHMTAAAQKQKRQMSG
ncbi:hypothetical protein QG37_00981 [Candidozyma auris]|uniref:Uncharacterized protein n=1 Tax=Candidozyma auris TaxID=498019 RepID=A0A0L0P5K5_CANAR|nr:hypothetical protein QG37_00981 [[Candida] auris]